MLSLFFIGCDGDSRCTVCPDGAKTWYFNSFEYAADTAGWLGPPGALFMDDPAPKCGDQSVYVVGSCNYPRARLIFPMDSTAGLYALSCWAKCPPSHSAGISLSISEPVDWFSRRKIWVRADSEEWTFLETDKPLYCPPEDSLMLELLVGGIRGGGLYLDCVKIEKLE
jgi:hypothetical protein